MQKYQHENNANNLLLRSYNFDYYVKRILENRPEINLRTRFLVQLLT